MRNALADVKFAARCWQKPGFTAGAYHPGLGLANTAIFSGSERRAAAASALCRCGRLTYISQSQPTGSLPACRFRSRNMRDSKAEPDARKRRSLHPLTLSWSRNASREAIFWSASNGDFFSYWDFPITRANVRYRGGNVAETMWHDQRWILAQPFGAMTLFSGGRSRWMGKT